MLNTCRFSNRCFFLGFWIRFLQTCLRNRADAPDSGKNRVLPLARRFSGRTTHALRRRHADRFGGLSECDASHRYGREKIKWRKYLRGGRKKESAKCNSTGIMFAAFTGTRIRPERDAATSRRAPGNRDSISGASLLFPSCVSWLKVPAEENCGLSARTKSRSSWRHTRAMVCSFYQILTG